MAMGCSTARETSSRLLELVESLFLGFINIEAIAGLITRATKRLEESVIMRVSGR